MNAPLSEITRACNFYIPQNARCVCFCNVILWRIYLLCALRARVGARRANGKRYIMIKTTIAHQCDGLWLSVSELEPHAEFGAGGDSFEAASANAIIAQ